MQFSQITYFLRTCDTLNFTRAAELCHVSQPSLSAAIKKLEYELGGKLFERQGRGIELTKLGHAMRVQFSRIEQARLAASKTAADITRHEKSTLNLGFMCTLDPCPLVSVLSTSGIAEQVDELLVHDISAAKPLDILASGGVDCLLFAHSNTLPEHLNVVNLTTDRMVLALSEAHPLASQKKVNLQQLQAINYIDRLGCEFRELFFNEIIEQGISINVVLRCEREDVVQKMVAGGFGVSIMPKSAAIESGLHYSEVTGMNIVRNISLVTLKGNRTKPFVQQLIISISDTYNS